MGFLELALLKGPAVIRDAAWIARFLRWREEKRAKHELDSQKKEGTNA